MPDSVSPAPAQVVYVKKESWILQLAALALWTIVTCWIAYRMGQSDARLDAPAKVTYEQR